jgi:hypothetical protein
MTLKLQADCIRVTALLIRSQTLCPIELPGHLADMISVGGAIPSPETAPFGQLISGRAEHRTISVSGRMPGRQAI